MTKRDYYNIIIEKFEGMQDLAVASEVIEFAKHEIELLDKKASRAKEKAKEKSAASDAITDLIKDLLTDEPKTITEIVNELDDESITNAKVSYRLSKLASDGFAVKTEVKVDKRKLSAYSKAEV